VGEQPKRDSPTEIERRSPYRLISWRRLLYKVPRHHKNGQYEGRRADITMSNSLDEAERQIRDEIERNPRSPDAHIKLSALLLTRRRTMDALQAADAALALDRNCADAHCARGVVLLDMDQPVLASIAFRRALTLEPNHRDSLLHLGRSGGAGKVESRPVAPPEKAWAGHLIIEYPPFAGKVAFAPQAQNGTLSFGRILKGGLIRDLVALVKSVAPERNRFGSAIDLASSTGLCAAELNRHYDIPTFVGVGSSREALAAIAPRKIFTTLVEGDGAEGLDRIKGVFDLVIAIGEATRFGHLDAWFAKVVPRLSQNGMLLYSMDLSRKSDIEPMRDGIFGHTPAYIEGLAATYGLRSLQGHEKPMRLEYGQSIPGYIGVLGRP
jgi:tetratricopeptide (TPR) repeat protein